MAMYIKLLLLVACAMVMDCAHVHRRLHRPDSKDITHFKEKLRPSEKVRVPLHCKITDDTKKTTTTKASTPTTEKEVAVVKSTPNPLPIGRIVYLRPIRRGRKPHHVKGQPTCSGEHNAASDEYEKFEIVSESPKKIEPCSN